MVREHPVLLTVGGEDLFAIVTQPPTGAPAPKIGIVFLTRPRAHRNRMWVDAARALAAKGFTGIRLDYHGEGDSTGESRRLEIESPYARDAVAAIRHLVEVEGVQRIGVVGSCFDARTALAAVHDAPRYDALVFMSAPVLDEGAEMARIVEERDLAHYVRRLREPGAWRALLSPERVGVALRVVLARGARRLGLSRRNGRAAVVPASDAPPGAAPSVSAGFRRDFKALVARGTPALFLYGDRDAQYPGFRIAMDGALPALAPDARARLEFAVLEGEAHGYLSVAIQSAIVERTCAWLEKTLAAGRAA
jgi:dienelactone hydrolase